ncbi:MAG: Two component transcriptional regulator, winged helix family [Candidatus Woesebacteria bacterium GW2011_GWA1_37_7]|uniref:DNA-binding response regulator n=2 Tax=Patescibacteria group TaxID=1783273 RepID=A0A1F6VIK7_9BACT|nr:MAG: Two component transcriptional regulator, winged helix family [Candidatus Woesebacteria bacterium GW2011_GWA1_37_7]OGI69409.1 MAG: DNA-binding response regulator [Candidatus Nomurabacteria bacterium RIFCSPHIGHO2_01_FULL_42_16]
MRILLVEDEQRLSNVIKKGLLEDGFAVDVAYDGEEGQYLAEGEIYDLVILDIMLPKVDGLTLCHNLRDKNIKTPILMLTAKTTIEDKVAGLDSGADDYMTKPFSFLELRSRIQALIRRSKQESSPILKVADLVLDPIKHTVTRKDKNITLTPKEFSILELLLRHKDEVVTRTMITEHAWDYNFDSMSNIVDVFVASLRRKVDKASDKKLIHTVHGVGYRLSESL